MLNIQALTGAAAARHIDALARLRIAVFREFPYLYDGDMAYEKDYLSTFLQAPDSLLIVVFDGDEVVGASSALPMEYETENIQRPFLERGENISKIFYYGESVLLPAYRGRGIGNRFFEEREQWARRLVRFDTVAFCAVVRPEDHPRQPENYRPLDGFWRKLGFHPTNRYCQISWKDHDEKEESPKSLRFWVKKI